LLGLELGTLLGLELGEQLGDTLCESVGGVLGEVLGDVLGEESGPELGDDLGIPLALEVGLKLDTTPEASWGRHSVLHSVSNMVASLERYSEGGWWLCRRTRRQPGERRTGTWYR